MISSFLVVIFYKSLSCQAGLYLVEYTLFLIYLCSNHYHTWHDSSLTQNLSKALKFLMTSSLSRVYAVIKQFLLSFEFKIRDPLSFAQFDRIFTYWSISKSRFQIWTEKFDINRISVTKMKLLSENWKVWPSLLLQKYCHGNAIGYCRLKTISVDALYNYTESQKVSLAYYKPFLHSKAKTYRRHIE